MKAVLVTLLLLYPAIAGADPNQYPGLPSGAAGCSLLITEAECRQHRQTLDNLCDTADRLAYLEQHAAMLREREVMCGNADRRQVLARAYYR